MKVELKEEELKLPDGELAKVIFNTLNPGEHIFIIPNNILYFRNALKYRKRDYKDRLYFTKNQGKKFAIYRFY